MPTKQQKGSSVDALRSNFERAQIAIIADYRGLTVAQLTDLRRRVQKAGGDVVVSKNTLVKVATSGHESWSSLETLLAGPTAIVFGFDDVVGPAKALNDFAKEKRAVKVTVRGGVLQGKAISAKGVEGLAELPSREVLVAQLLGVLNGPVRGLVTVLSGTNRSLVYALDAIRKQKEEQSA